MKVLIAGAGGVIGLALIERLAADGHDVTGVTRSPDRGRAIRAAGATAIMCDVLLEGQLTSAVQSAAPEAIVYELTELSAGLDPADGDADLAAANRMRREGTRTVIAAAKATGVGRLLAPSVAFAYAPEGDWVKSEEAPLAVGPGSPVKEAVAAVADLERQVLDAGGTVLRYGHLYGAGTAFGGKGRYAELVRRRQLPIAGTAEGRWSFVLTGDAATATALALEHATPGVYNIVDDDPARASDWLPVYAQAVGAKPPRKLPDALASRMLGPLLSETVARQRGASNAKARRELGWTPSPASWREGFAAAIAAENRERRRWAR